MSVKSKLQSDMKDALRAGDKARLGAIRLALAAVKQREVDSRESVDDAGVQTILKKMIKQGRAAAETFAAAGRADLAAKEAAEIDCLQSYLPAQLADDALRTLIDEAVTETGAQSQRDLGKVMNVVKRQVAGRADMATVTVLVKAALNSLNEP